MTTPESGSVQESSETFVKFLGEQDLQAMFTAMQDAQLKFRGDEELEAALRVPTMAVTGAQSSGKTSYIESMVGFRVGPTAKGTATRCPVRYILRKKNDVSYKVDGVDIPGANNSAMRENLREGVQRRMKEKVPHLGFSVEQIRVEINDPGVIDIDIIDLPGLKSKDDPGFQEIRDIVKAYLTDENTIPVALSLAQKTHETTHDLDLLAETGLDLNKAILIVNGCNNEMRHMSTKSDVAEWMRGYKHKFNMCSDVKFVMLHHNIMDNDPIDKDRMSQEQAEDYYSTLPVKEKQKFEAFVTSREGDAAMPADLMSNFGVAAAHKQMQTVISTWMRKNASTVISTLKTKQSRLQRETQDLEISIQTRELQKNQLNTFTVDYGFSWLATMKGLRQGIKITVDDPNKRKVYVTRFQKMTHEEELAKFIFTSGRGGDVEAEDKLHKAFETICKQEELTGTYTGAALKKKLSCNAAIDRLLHVAGYVVMADEMVEFDEDQIHDLCVSLSDGMAHTVSQEHVVNQIVRDNLNRLFPPVFDRVLDHVQQLCKEPCDSAHEILRDFQYKEMSEFRQFTDALNTEFDTWTKNAHHATSLSLRSMLEEKLATINADIDTRLTQLVVLATNSNNELVWDHTHDQQTLGKNDLNDPAFQHSPVLRVPSLLEPNPTSVPFAETLLSFKPQRQTSLKKDQGKESTSKQMLPHQQDSRTALQAMRLEAKNQKPSVKIIDFVEGGETDVPKTEYRRTDVEHVNRLAKKYFHYYRGLFFMELESKVRLFVSRVLEHGNGGDDELHKHVRQLCERMFQDEHFKDDIFAKLETTTLENRKQHASALMQQLQETMKSLRLSTTGKPLSNM